ncbi:class IV adenylate cyclase [Palaeococcus sp. (in: euryarchaeotes)]|uniref:class IV adenylate cyclase n=1 Tax=Palaeococcus sp. (in: euryarchaeotes) TaxID=2820298 RepID=UPI000F164EF4|nr:class IV adenylate cyclase [Palaeococcus sp. (in: euryarchaeotes)]MCD6559436.1 class IV adenylate cyclase [Palaeococcus sp. (in: euryarchaeotes)]RLF78196.1 MAG: class IV adenylate cyclase [Thermococci archaeon]
MEIEIKFRVELEEIMEKIEALGAGFVGEEVQEDLYFSLPPKHLLRIRRIANLGQSILGYKYIQDERNEEFDEIEVEVSDFEKMKEILKRLGFREDVWVKKHRLVYKLDDVTFELNRVEGLGDFLDIEVMSEDVEYAKKRIWEIAGLLGLNEEDVEPRLYQELLEETTSQSRQS